jgi:transcription initiation factor IIE alpha subunit
METDFNRIIFAIDVRHNLTRHQGTMDWTLDELQTAITRETEIMGYTCEQLPPRSA